MSLKLEDIQNLSEEIRALVEARLPLEPHLADAGQGRGRTLVKLTQSITDGLTAGKSLEATIRDSATGAPAMVACAVAAGVRSGNLALSVELLGDMASDIAWLRKSILHAMTYPLTVLAIALMLFVVFIREFLIRMYDVLADLRTNISPYLVRVLEFDESFPAWPLVFPVLAAILVVVWLLTGRASAMTFRGPERLMLMIPGVGSMIRDLQFFTLTRMIELMIAQQMEMSEALLLAGGCTGNPALDRACRQAAARVSAGESLVPGTQLKWRPGRLPPLLSTCLTQASNEPQLLSHLRGVASHYHRRLQVNVTWLQHVVPVAMFVVIGGGTALLYGLTVFWPVAELYQHLGE